MTAGAPMDRAGVGGSVGTGDRGEKLIDEDSGAGGRGFPTATPDHEQPTPDQERTAPEHEPAAAERSPAAGEPALAPDGPAPDLSRVNPGDGPGESPGQ
jgi:hypothetical protein